MKYFLYLFALLVAIAQPLKAQQHTPLTGNWNGYINIQGQHLRFNMHFTKSDSGLDGTADIPQQGAEGLALRKIKQIGKDSVSWNQDTGGNGIARFNGTFEVDSTITGTFSQKGRKFPFKMNLSGKKEKTTDANNNKPLPYNHKEVIIKNDSIKIGGTLTWPEDEKANQLVIMISGSGAQDRDEATPVTDFEPFAELADSLTSSGIATFRYDDRGIDKSTGQFSDATLSMLASDVKAIINHFSDDQNKEFKTIVLLGHSQGGIVGGKVAKEDNRVDKLILMASPGVTLKRVLRAQIMHHTEKASIKKKIEIQEVNAREDLMRAIKNKQGLKQAKENYLQKFKAMQIAVGVDSSKAERLAEGQTQSLLKIYGTPQMQSLLFYNPTDDLENLDIPVLALFGGKDTQVSVELNRRPTQKALDKANITYNVKTFKNANHPFQEANTGKVQEYSTLKSQFVDGFLSTIEDWLKENSKN